MSWVEWYYGGMFLASLVCTIIYACLWRKHFSASFTLTFALIPIANLGFLLQAVAGNEELYLQATKIAYIGGCFLPFILFLNICNLCHVKVPKPVQVLMLLGCMGFFLSAQTIGSGPIFYRSIHLKMIDGVRVPIKEYGPMHAVFYLLLGIYFAISLGVILYSYFRKKEISRKIIWLLFLPEVVALVCFFGGRFMTDRLELLPAGYVFAQIMYLLITQRICLYDISETAIDSLMQTGTTGFISFDFKMNYLGSNETAKNIYPELKTMTVDRNISRNRALAEIVMPWIKRYQVDEKENKNTDRRGDRIYQIDVNGLYDGSKRKGYQLVINDDTERQKYVLYLSNRKEELSREVEERTRDLVQMHDDMIRSMAVMVESRDNSTGGHIIRTSDVVKILMEEIARDADFMKKYGLDEGFGRRIRKAAPLHDIGKIAVRDEILRKPSRFTPEEFEIMKTHAPEGARILRKILRNLKDEEFKKIAENVAHYHHERMDGSGYPDGLKGEEIPIEARIMAIADVYDALVSKRIYKDSMPFDKADGIMMDSMGKHFDPNLEKFYVAARPRMEAYYRSLPPEGS